MDLSHLSNTSKSVCVAESILLHRSFKLFKLIVSSLIIATDELDEIEIESDFEHNSA